MSCTNPPCKTFDPTGISFWGSNSVYTTCPSNIIYQGYREGRFNQQDGSPSDRFDLSRATLSLKTVLTWGQASQVEALYRLSRMGLREGDATGSCRI